MQGFFCTCMSPSFFKPEAPSIFIYGSKHEPQGPNDLYSTWSAGRAVKYIYMGEIFWLLSLYINGFTKRWKALKSHWKERLSEKLFSQVSHQFKQVPPNFRDHLRGPHFYCGFHLPSPSPAASARFPEWKLAQRDKRCATGTPSIAAERRAQRQNARM